MGYACGLLCKLAGREVPQWETPVELKDRVAELLTGYEPANEREKNVIHMLHYYHPDETADEQVKELIAAPLADTEEVVTGTDVFYA